MSAAGRGVQTAVSGNLPKSTIARSSGTRARIFTNGSAGSSSVARMSRAINNASQQKVTIARLFAAVSETVDRAATPELPPFSMDAYMDRVKALARRYDAESIVLGESDARALYDDPYVDALNLR